MNRIETCERGVHNRKLGAQGEELAARYLQDLGYAILRRNFRAGRSEIDIIARYGRILVFAEVKTRTSNRFGSGAEAITRHKRSMIKRTAIAFLQEHAVTANEVRFDVMLVDPVLRTVEHLQNAF